MEQGTRHLESALVGSRKYFRRLMPRETRRRDAAEKVDALFATPACLYAVGNHEIMKRC
jgi:hypothetical protein